MKKFIQVCVGIVLVAWIVGHLINWAATRSLESPKPIATVVSPIISAPSPPAHISTPAELKAEKARAVADARASEKEKELLRIAYAKFTENNLLRADINVDVTASGAGHRHLTMKWVLANKAMIFNFQEQRQDMLKQMTEAGFNRFTITDGYEESWSWDLTK